MVSTNPGETEGVELVFLCVFIYEMNNPGVGFRLSSVERKARVAIDLQHDVPRGVALMLRFFSRRVAAAYLPRILT